MSTQWDRIKQIFQEAVDRSPKERAAFVIESCAGDENLRQEIESLLRVFERSGGYIEKPVLASPQFCDGLESTQPESSPNFAVAGGIHREASVIRNSHRFTPGTVLSGRYRVISFLGQGGMGEVYRADDLKLGQPVALKFLSHALAPHPSWQERFLSEVRITRQLSHPNICRVYDVADFDGQVFLSMEYVDGENLESLIKRIGYLPNEKALDVARQLAAGLAAAHERGVLHRDLKPANIMIDGHGHVRIMDFGLAITAEDVTQAAEEVGTFAYMAPEQFAGRGASVRSDIYSFGLVLYEVFCGKRAFSGKTRAEIREQKESQTPVLPSQIRQGLDPDIEGLILRCIDRDPRVDRTASCNSHWRFQEGIRLRLLSPPARLRRLKWLPRPATNKDSGRQWPWRFSQLSRSVHC
jgi:serine/threonine protein kinase